MKSPKILLTYFLNKLLKIERRGKAETDLIK